MPDNASHTFAMHRLHAANTSKSLRHIIWRQRTRRAKSALVITVTTPQNCPQSAHNLSQQRANQFNRRHLRRLGMLIPVAAQAEVARL